MRDSVVVLRNLRNNKVVRGWLFVMFVISWFLFFLSHVRDRPFVMFWGFVCVLSLLVVVSMNFHIKLDELTLELRERKGGL